VLHGSESMKLTKKMLKNIIQEEIESGFKDVDRAATTRYSGPDSQNFYGTFRNLLGYAERSGDLDSIARDIAEAIKSTLGDDMELSTELYKELTSVMHKHSRIR